MLRLFGYFEAIPFFVALGIGALLVYMFAPSPKVVIRWPTPENAGKVTYIDKKGVCYKYKASKVPCTHDAEQPGI